MRVTQKVVLISDGGHPSAEALAARFRRDGAVVAVNYPETSAADAESGFSYDCRSMASAGALLEAVLKRFGKIDILLFNHNRVEKKEFFATDDETFLRSMDYNLKTAFSLTRTIGAYMKENGGGSMVYLASIHSEKPTGMDFSYAMAKGGVAMLARETALDLGPYGVRANVIEWGAMAGDDTLYQSDLSPLYENMEMKIPSGQPGSYEQVAELACFLAGDLCPHINGEVMVMDGGFLQTYFVRYNYEEWEAREQ